MGITTNLALNKTATASGFVAPYSASRAVDGALTTFSRWLSNSVPSWLCVDLGANYLINRWVVRHMSVAGWRSPDYNMCDFKLQGSNDNKTWIDIDSVVGNTASITDRSFIAVNVRYVRVNVTKGLRCNTQYASLMEFEVYPAPASAYLTGLAISSGTLSPAPFAGKTTLAYTASVGYDTSSINVLPMAEDTHAIIKVNNVVVTSGQVSGPIPLSVGSNAITVLVTASDGSSQVTYTITVTRAGSQYLSGLTLSSGTLAPAFAGRTAQPYTASVGYDTTSITVTPTAEDSNAIIKVNGATVASGSASGAINLNVGANTITVVVTAAVTGTQQTYTITVTRYSPYLSGLTISSGPFNETFAKTTFAYTSTVANTVTSITVTPTAEDTTATITVNGTVVASGNASTAIPLNEGPNNAITVIVTPNIGTAQTYTITVTRTRSVYLTNLTVIPTPADPNAKLDPLFGTETFGYTYKVAIGTTSVRITPTPSAGATVTVNNQSLTGTFRVVSLTSLPMVIPVKVSKGGVDLTYNITVTN